MPDHSHAANALLITEIQAVDHCTDLRGVWSAENLAQSEGGRLAADKIVRAQNAMKKVSSSRRKASFGRNTDREAIDL